MAQFRLSVSIASRGKGRSAVAMAAYRSGEAILDERTGERFDFTRKGGIVSRDLVLPDGAPQWAQERATFWNRSEAADKRADAQIAREIQISLPHELSDRERRELTTGFSQHIAERFGIAVDTCIHRPHEKGDERNHHAHLLLSTRPFDEGKKTGLGNKVRALDNIAHQRQGHGQEQKSENEVEQLRQVWAQRVNEALQRAEVHTPEGVSVQVDHRSYERQGIDREPTVKEGVAATGLKRRGLPSERGDINAEIRERNQQRDQIQNQIGAAARELATLQKSIQEDEVTTLSDGVAITNMTEAQRQAQLREDSRIAEFRARNEDYIQQLKEADKVQNIGRDYDFRFADTGDLQEQVREKEQQIDYEFMDDERGLIKQDLQDRKAFDDRIKGERQAMREQDARESQAEAQRFKGSPDATKKEIAEGRDVLNQQREQTRNHEEIKMRQEFGEFQDQRHHDRLANLNDRNDQNTEKLEQKHQQEAERLQLLRDQSLTPRQTANRTQDDLRRDLTPTESSSEGVKPKKGETQDQANERAERMEKARKEREQQEAQNRDPRKKDDWTR